MKQFEIGKKYYTTSACDHNCIFVIEIVKRTDKTVTIIEDGKKRRTKLFSNQDSEYIIPHRYSMPPIFYATREYVIPPKQAELDNVSALHCSPKIQIGQRVYGNFGATFPIEWGTVVKFEELPATRFSRGGAYTIRWDENEKRPSFEEKIGIDEIRPHDYRSVNGSPIGIFYVV